MIRRVHLNRLLSKRGILTRSQANTAILAGRVSVNGRVVRDPGKPIEESARIELDAQTTAVRVWRTILFHKPRGVITTRQDPEGRTTIYDVARRGRSRARPGREARSGDQRTVAADIRHETRGHDDRSAKRRVARLCRQRARTRDARTLRSPRARGCRARRADESRRGDAAKVRPAASRISSSR